MKDEIATPWFTGDRFVVLSPEEVTKAQMRRPLTVEDIEKAVASIKAERERPYLFERPKKMRRDA